MIQERIELFECSCAINTPQKTCFDDFDNPSMFKRSTLTDYGLDLSRMCAMVFFVDI